MSTRTAVIVVCCLTDCTLSAEEQLPTSPPPIIGVAIFTPQGLQMRLFETRIVAEKRVRKIPYTTMVDGKPVTKYRDDEYVVQRPVTVPVTRVYKAVLFRVYNATGRLLLKADLETRLQQTVLLSADGRQSLSSIAGCIGPRL